MYIPLFIFILMLLFPSLTKQGAYNGLILWLYTIIPTLLPYMIISSIIYYLNAFNIVSSLLYPITKRIFGISKNANYCLIIGFLCGYPMGSKTIADMLKDGAITYEEATYLLSFCNNISPSFLINYVLASVISICYKTTSTLSLTIGLIIFLSPIITSFLYRMKEPNYNKNPIINSNTNNSKNGIDFLDKCILNSFENIFKIGGYIIIFSIISTWIISANFFNDNISFVLSSVFEITSGLYSLRYTDFSSSIGTPLVIALCSFGGLCSIAQTYSVISDSGLNIKTYTAYKIVNSIIAFVLSLIIL